MSWSQVMNMNEQMQSHLLKREMVFVIRLHIEMSFKTQFTRRMYFERVYKCSYPHISFLAAKRSILTFLACHKWWIWTNRCNRTYFDKKWYLWSSCLSKSPFIAPQTRRMYFVKVYKCSYPHISFLAAKRSILTFLAGH